jgi:hypothetical protein
MRPTLIASVSSLPVRMVAAASLLVLGLLGACGGRQLGGSPGGGSDGGVFTEPDGATCVDINAGTYDTSCNLASDCITIASGPICDGFCNCGGGNVAVNRSGQSRYDSALSAVTPSTGTCGCLSAGPPACVHGTCTFCDDGDCSEGGTGFSDGGSGGSDGGTGSSEASTGSSDASACVDINLASYDQSCKKTSDCISITSGEICSGQCNCGGSTINKSGEGQYESAISGLTLEDCPCVEEGSPTCVLGMCVMCGGPKSPPGCPDGG